MSASNSKSDVFDHDAASTWHWCRLDPSHDPKVFTYPPKALPVIGQGSLLLDWHRQLSVEQITTMHRIYCCQLPSRRLGHYAFHKEPI
jgi:hypothetical protein